MPQRFVQFVVIGAVGHQDTVVFEDFKAVVYLIDSSREGGGTRGTFRIRKCHIGKHGHKRNDVNAYIIIYIYMVIYIYIYIYGHIYSHSCERK